MREDDLRESENVEDRRGAGFRTGGLGIGAIVALGLLSWALGINPADLIQSVQTITGGDSPSVSQSDRGRTGTPADPTGIFVARVLGETEDVWSELLPQEANREYTKPILVLFSGVTRSGCGTAQSAAGPFYCPLDQKLYLDTSFFQDMQRRFGGGGDFAYAYVIAHEVGHHVQNLIGLLPKVQQAERSTSDRGAANAISVRTELMADCLAGVWANKMNQRHRNIDENDVREAVKAAAAIGDDRLERQSQGYVVPDSFTHGTSDQRVRWLTTGLRAGKLAACNTFEAQEL